MSANLGTLKPARAVQTILTYSNSKHSVTQCSVVVQQSHLYGHAYISSGGIGNKNVQFIVETPTTGAYIISATIYAK